MVFQFGLFGSILSFSPDSGDFWTPENQDSRKLSDAFEALLRPLFDSGKDFEIIGWQAMLVTEVLAIKLPDSQIWPVCVRIGANDHWIWIILSTFRDIIKSDEDLITTCSIWSWGKKFQNFLIYFLLWIISNKWWPKLSRSKKKIWSKIKYRMIIE